MWTLTNETPYSAGRIWGRDREGAHEWIVVVKGTFVIKPDGTLSRADEQFEPLLVPEYFGAVGASSLRYDADLVGPKPTTDILLNGTAYAPRGRPSTKFMVSLRVGNILKRIVVVGDRTWQTSGASAPAPVVQVPIVYERAYGGFDRAHSDPAKQRFDPRNPVGCGLVKRGGASLPNFEYPGAGIETTGPAGFGALDSFWSPRLELQGKYDAFWKERRFPLPPSDCDPQCVLCSPADQRPKEHLLGGEQVELENLTPDGRLTFVLPRVHYVFTTYIDNRIEEHQGRLVTVIIEPDLSRLVLVWQSVLTVRNDGDYLERTLVTMN